MHRFDTPDPPHLHIEVRSGTLTIDTADTADTTVDIRPARDSEAARHLVAATVVEQRGDEIVVFVPKRSGSLFGRSADLIVTITAPHRSALAVQSDAADVTASGEYGTTIVTTGSGDVRLGQILDSARLRTGSGDVRVDAVTGDLDVRSGSGAIDVGATAGSMSAQTGSGDVTLGTGGRGARVTSGSGDITVVDAPADLSVNTASGDIRIAAVGGGEVSAKAASGDIRAGVRAGTAAWLDVRTISGRVSSELDSGAEPGAEEPRVRLKLQTVSGDIDLVRV